MILDNEKKYFRKTKIICTIGPASASLPVLREMYKAGMNIVRLNMSHSDHRSALEIIKKIKMLNKTATNPVALLLDTQGPEIRTADIKENFMLTVGEHVEITVGGGGEVEEKSTIVVNYQDMIKDVQEGDRITVDNGLINLDVVSKSDFGLKCIVVDGGLIKSRRHINLPGIRVNLPAITPKDEQDILFAVKHDIDFIALSFVRSATDVEECQRIINRHKGHALVIAKIEDKFGVENVKEIINVSAGIMVARGDLGVEVPIEELPVIQRKIIKGCAEAGKKCIVATHLLESMIENPIPTRAEVTDVANAAYEEADSVMLSGETSVGKYPVKCIEYFDKILSRTELSGGIAWARNREIGNSTKQQLAKASVQMADSLKADALVVITRRGIMADHVTSFHPVYPVVLAFTNMSTVRRKLLLNRSCYPYRIDFSNDPEKTIQNAFNAIMKKNLFKEGATVVVVSDILAGDYRVDAIQVRHLEKIKIAKKEL